MITYFLIFIVISLLAGFAVQDYEGIVLKLEMYDYIIEANVVFAALMLCIVVLSLILVTRLCLTCAVWVHKVKCKAIAKQYEEIGRCFAFLSVGNVEDVRQILEISDRFSKLHCSVLPLLEGCACLRLGQYEVAERYFSLLHKRNFPDGRLGVFIVRILEEEQSKDCRLRVLNRLSNVFCAKPWSSILRLESAIMEERWSDVLTEQKFILRNDIPHPHDMNTLGTIARCKLAELCYQRGNFKEGLRLLQGEQGLQAVILSSKLHAKLNNFKRSAVILEEFYMVDPHPEIAEQYITVSTDSNKAIERLCSFNPDCYVSALLMARRYISLKRHSAAEQCIQHALEEFKYVQLYCAMIDIMVQVGDLGEVAFWVDAMRKESVPDAHWQCNKCATAVDKWSHECLSCGKFNSIRWI